MVATATWDALGTWCEVLCVRSDDLPEVAALARARVAELDAAWSPGRPDGELASLEPDRPRAVSPALAGAVAAALRTAEFTDGLVAPAADWRAVRLAGRQLTVPVGPRLDLTAGARAWAADWVADACADELGVGCLVNLGGDIAVRGDVPDGGWQVEIDDGRPGPQGHPVISMGWGGGLATSSLGAADPAHPDAARTWRTVTVAARSCERAAAACAAALRLGDAAPRWLTQRELPARLVHTGGVVVQTNGWPQQHFVP